MFPRGARAMATIIREQRAGLSVLVRQPEGGGGPKALVVLLHGWGADAADLMDLSPAIAAKFPDALVAAPDGPAPCSANPSGRQWFDLAGEAVDDGPSESAPMLLELVDGMLGGAGLGLDRLALVGFSQGAMMALHVGLRLPGDCAGVVSFAGALLAPERLAAERKAAPRVLLVHGRDDEVVPFQAMVLAEGMLKSNGIEVRAVARDGLGHGIDGEGFGEALEFLGDALSAKERQ